MEIKLVWKRLKKIIKIRVCWRECPLKKKNYLKKMHFHILQILELRNSKKILKIPLKKINIYRFCNEGQGQVIKIQDFKLTVSLNNYFQNLQCYT